VEERLNPRTVGRVVNVCVAALVLLALAAWLRAPGDLLTFAVLVAAFVLAGVLAAQFALSRRLSARRAERDAGITRMLQGMSRSASADAIVDTIIDELRRAADADHVLVARMRPTERVVEATLVSTRARVPVSRTVLPLSVLDPSRLPAATDAADGASTHQRVADEIARRLSGSYALPHTLALPLVSHGRVLGALIGSRRQAREWTATDRELLTWAAAELSAALARAFAFEVAENQAYVDGLTGLPNRRYLEELLDTVIPRRRTGDRLGILMIDLDHFKQLNDRFGHATGDRVLRAVAETISNAVRLEDTPARYGGEEFVVVLRRASSDQAADVAERIRAEIAAIPPVEMSLTERITVSIGVAVADNAEPIDVRELIEAADSALYRAKKQGRNRVVVVS
jgi:diguanylate cyclase (GGDEF)-like protein